MKKRSSGTSDKIMDFITISGSVEEKLSRLKNIRENEVRQGS